MNWKRILNYCIIYYFASAIAAAPFGIISGLLGYSVDTTPFWVFISITLAGSFASIAVIARLAYIQRDKPFYHALIVGLVNWSISLPINVGLMHGSVRNWALGLGLILVAVVVGVAIGIFLYRRKGISNSNT